MYHPQHAKPSIYESNIKPFLDEVAKPATEEWFDSFKDGLIEFRDGLLDSMILEETETPRVLSRPDVYDQDAEDDGFEAPLKPLFDYEQFLNKKVATATFVAAIGIGAVATAPAAAATPASSSSESGSGNSPAAASITVQSGQNLTEIAKQVYPANPLAAVNQIAKLNNLSNPNLIYPGEALKIPSTPVTALGYDVKTLQAGQTIFGLSKQYGFTLGQFEADNPGVNPNVVYAGEAYKIPIGTVNYVVKPGESEWSVAAAVTTSAAQTASVVNVIQAMNPNVNPTALQSGQTLVVPGNVAVAAETPSSSQPTTETSPSTVASGNASATAPSSNETASVPVPAQTSAPSPAVTAPAPASATVPNQAPSQPTSTNANSVSQLSAETQSTTQSSVTPTTTPNAMSATAPEISQPVPAPAQTPAPSTAATAPAPASATAPNQAPSQPSPAGASSTGSASGSITFAPKIAAASETNNGNLSGNVTIQQLADYMEANTNLTEIAIAGFIGNDQAESGGNTERVENSPVGSETSYNSLTPEQQQSGNVGWGLFQDTPPNTLGIWAKANHLDPNTLATQVEYVVVNYPGVVAAANAATTPQQAADIVLNQFERPADPAESQALREQDAVLAYNTIVGNSSGSNANQG